MAQKKMNLSSKRLAIDKSNATMVAQVSIAAFIAVFCLVSINSLLGQRAYQAKVESKKEVALAQLESNIAEVDQLVASYQEFAGATENVLGGNPDGNGDRDGENPRIVLDALPSVYDFPALATSLEKMLKDNNITIDNITGTDEEVSQSGQESSPNPAPVEMPFTVEATTSPSSSKRFLSLFERSIRPIQIQTIIMEGQESQISFTIEAKSYYQPEKGLSVVEEKVQ
jgi:hypothetical protein